MIVYIVMGTYKEKIPKPLNNMMIGFLPSFRSRLAALHYAKEGNYPVIRLDTNAKSEE